MSDDYEVGRGKPPREHQFKAGNQAARGRKKRQSISLPEMLEKALNRRRQIKRGGEIVSMKAGEIMIERFVQMMTTGSPRELIMMFGLIEKHAPKFLEQHAADIAITYQTAEGTSIDLPPTDLWEVGK